MNKKSICIALIILLVFVIGCVLLYNTYYQENKSEIIEIPIDSVEGITQTDAEKLCYHVMGEKDKETGFSFSFGTSGAVKKGKKQYYTIRASWLVNNSHLSYIGDFFVSADGKEIFSGSALPGEYVMEEKIWSE